MSVRFNNRVVAGPFWCVVACAGLMAGCELDNAPVPQIIPGPSVPSPLPLQPPYVWDTREELVVWTANSVSRGSFSIDGDDVSAAIRIQLAGTTGGIVLLRGPNIDPPAQAIGAARIRYQWLPDSPSRTLSLWASFDVANSPSADLQPRASATLKPGSGWQEIEFRNSPPLDIRYLYFWTYEPGVGLLNIDTIALLSR